MNAVLRLPIPSATVMRLVCIPGLNARYLKRLKKLVYGQVVNNYIHQSCKNRLNNYKVSVTTENISVNCALAPINARTILKIYARHWPRFILDRDFSWGKMDPDDNIAETGLEIVIRPPMFNQLLALPSIGSTDQAILQPSIWEDCPTQNFRPEEMPMVNAVTRHLRISIDELERRIEEGSIAEEGSEAQMKLEEIEKVSSSLGFS